MNQNHGINRTILIKDEKGKLVYCRFQLSVNGQQTIYGCVVKILHIQPAGNHTKNVEYRGEFVFMEERIRESIIKYIFEEERRMIRRS